MKIKKYLLYILIIVILFGVFVPTSNVSAAGYCVGNPDISTRSACEGVGGSTWVENGAGGNGGFGCQLPSNPKLQGLLSYVTCILTSSVIPLIFALALVMFVWGVVQYVINSSEEAKKEKGRQFMIWGIIALTVMVSVWGLVNILGGTFGVKTGFIPQVAVPK